MKRTIDLKVILSGLALLAMTSCCQLCLKSFSVEPVWQQSGSEGGTAGVRSADLGAKGTIVFTECAYPAKCEAIRALNRQMKQINADYREGRIGWDEYSKRSDKYVAQLDSLSKQDKTVASENTIIPQGKSKALEYGAAPGTRFIESRDFATEADYQRAAIVEIQNTTSQLKFP